MTTKNFVPRSDNEGSIGTTQKRWGGANFTSANINTLNTNSIVPGTDGTATIGSLKNKFKAIYVNELHTGTTINNVDYENLSLKDNFIEINSGETGSGVTAGTAGISINRGEEVPYLIEFDEFDDVLRVGLEGNLDAVVTKDYVDNLTTNITDGTTPVSKADTLTNSRTISLTGHATGEIKFDGSEDVAIDTTNVNLGNLKRLARGTAYSVGDVCFFDTLPSWAYLECVTAGTTSTTVPSFFF